MLLMYYFLIRFWRKKNNNVKKITLQINLEPYIDGFVYFFEQSTLKNNGGYC